MSCGRNGSANFLATGDDPALYSCVGVLFVLIRNAFSYVGFAPTPLAATWDPQIQRSGAIFTRLRMTLLLRMHSVPPWNFLMFQTSLCSEDRYLNEGQECRQWHPGVKKGTWGSIGSHG